MGDASYLSDLICQESVLNFLTEPASRNATAKRVNDDTCEGAGCNDNASVKLFRLPEPSSMNPLQRFFVSSPASDPCRLLASQSMKEMGIQPGVMGHMETRQRAAAKVWLQCVVKKASTDTRVMKQVKKKTRHDSPRRNSQLQQSRDC